MNTADSLRYAIAQHRKNEIVFENSRTRLRGRVRAHLEAVTAKRGDLSIVAAAVGVSPTAICNAKGGYAAVSVDWAEKLLRATV